MKTHYTPQERKQIYLDIAKRVFNSNRTMYICPDLFRYVAGTYGKKRGIPYYTGLGYVKRYFPEVFQYRCLIANNEPTFWRWVDDYKGNWMMTERNARVTFLLFMAELCDNP